MCLHACFPHETQFDSRPLLTESFLDNRPPLIAKIGYFRKTNEHAPHRARSRSHCRGHFHFHELALDGRHLSSVPKRNASTWRPEGRAIISERAASPPRHDRHRLLIHTHRALQRRNFAAEFTAACSSHRHLGRDVAARSFLSPPFFIRLHPCRRLGQLLDWAHDLALLACVRHRLWLRS